MSAKYFLVLLLFLLGVVSCHTGYMSTVEIISSQAGVTASALAPAELERARALFTSFARGEGFRLEEHEWEFR